MQVLKKTAIHIPDIKRKENPNKTEVDIAPIFLRKTYHIIHMQLYTVYIH